MGAVTTVLEGDTVPASELSVGDLWVCTVTPSDLEDDGPSAAASYLVEACVTASNCDDINGCTEDMCLGGQCVRILVDCSATEGSLLRCADQCTLDGWSVPGSSCAAATDLGDLTDGGPGGVGRAVTINGNCGDSSNGDWYRFRATDNSLLDQAVGGDAWAVRLALTRNDDDLFRMRIYTAADAAPSCTSDQECTGFTGGPGWANLAGDEQCTGTEYSQTFYQRPCGDVEGWNYCEDNETHYWINVYQYVGACDACYQYSLSISTGNDCSSDDDCLLDYYCQPGATAIQSETEYALPDWCLPPGTNSDNPLDAGKIPDGGVSGGGNQVILTGSCDDMADGGDWYAFTATDDVLEDQADGGDAWGVSVELTEDSAGWFQMEVWCDGPECVEPVSGNLFELPGDQNPCGGDGETACTDDTTSFWLRIYGTDVECNACREYTLVLSAGTNRGP
jgi:hypothetical protein